MLAQNIHCVYATDFHGVKADTSEWNVNLHRAFLDTRFLIQHRLLVYTTFGIEQHGSIFQFYLNLFFLRSGVPGTHTEVTHSGDYLYHDGI